VRRLKTYANANANANENVLMATGGREQVRLQCALEGALDRSGDRSAGGRRFHLAGPLTTKLRCPVAVRARGTSRVPLAADRRC